MTCAHALLAALCVFRLLPHGFANRDLRPLIAQLLGKPPEAITSGQMSYDLRRLRMHGLIQRISHTHRYQVTSIGLTQAMFLTRLHDRVLRTGLASHRSRPRTPRRAASRRPRLPHSHRRPHPPSRDTSLNKHPPAESRPTTSNLTRS